MMQPWKLNEIQREARSIREEVAAWDATIERLDAQLADARGAEGALMERCATIRDRMGTIRRDPPLERVTSSNGAIEWLMTLEARAEYHRLEGELRTVEDELSPRMAAATTLAQRLGRARVARGVFGAQLADLEAKLSPGEIVQTGVEAGAYTEHRERVQAAREQAGIGG